MFKLNKSIKVEAPPLTELQFEHPSKVEDQQQPYSSLHFRSQVGANSYSRGSRRIVEHQQIIIVFCLVVGNQASRPDLRHDQKLAVVLTSTDVWAFAKET